MWLVENKYTLKTNMGNPLDLRWVLVTNMFKVYSLFYMQSSMGDYLKLYFLISFFKKKKVLIPQIERDLWHLWEAGQCDSSYRMSNVLSSFFSRSSIKC